MAYHRLAAPLVAALLGLSACGGGPATTGPTSAPATSAPATAPAALATSAPPATPTVPDPLTADLAALVRAQLPPAPTDSTTATLLITDVVALPLEGPQGTPLWAVATVGTSNAAVQRHFVALYGRAGESWSELGRVELENPPVLHSGALAQVDFVPGRVWLRVRGDSALIGPCCIDLLSFDGTTLRSELSYTDRTIADVTFEPGGQPPAVVITVVPYQGAASPPGELQRHVFTWDGERLAKQGGEN